MWTINYSNHAEETCYTLLYLEQHPYRASLKRLLPSFSSGDTLKSNVFQLTRQLCLMGHEVDFKQMITEITKQPYFKSDEDAKEFLENKILEKLYEIFKTISMSQNLYQLQDIKKLKKLIHTFARLNDFPQRILNTNKVAGLPKNQQYLVMDNTLLAKYTPADKEEKRSQRKRAKNWLNFGSFLISFIVGVGEGMTAAAFAATTMAFLPAFLLIGIPAFICNYYLFRGESLEVMKDIYFGRLFKTKEGNALARSEKVAVGLSLALTAAAATSIGFFTFSTSLTVFGHLIFGLTAAASIAAPPVGLLILVGFITTISAMALFTVFSSMMVNFIKSGGPKKIKIAILTAPNKLICFFKHGKWHELSTTDKMKHVFKKIATTIIHVVFFVLSAAVSILMVGAACILMKKQVSMIFHKTFKASAAFANKTANILILGVGSVINGAFFTEGIFNAFNHIKNLVLSGIKKLASGHKPTPKKSNPFRRWQTVVNSIKRVLMLACIVSNSKGEAAGVRHTRVLTKTGLATGVGIGGTIAEEAREAILDVQARKSANDNNRLRRTQRKPSPTPNNQTNNNASLFSQPAPRPPPHPETHEHNEKQRKSI